MAIISRMKYDEKGWPLSCRIVVSNGRDGNGKQKRESITWYADTSEQTTKRQRERAYQLAADKFEEDVKSGKYTRAANITLAQYLNEWLETYVKRELSTASHSACKSWIDRVIIPELGNIKLKSLKKVDLKEMYRKMEDGELTGNPTKYSSNTIRRVHQIISSALSVAVDDEILERNVCLGMKLTKKDKMADVKHFEDDQVIAFLESLDNPYFVTWRGRQHKDGTPSAEHKEEMNVQLQLKVLFYLAVFAGLRRGELLSLCWDDINFEDRTIDVTKSIELDKSKGESKSTKNASSNRIVKVPQMCIELLSELKQERGEYKAAMVGRWKGNPSNDLIFIKEDGTAMGKDTPNRAFRSAIKRYNDTHEDQLPEITLHGLRHTAASILIDSGMSDVTVADVLGHSDPSTTKRIYAHAFRKAKDEAADVMDERLSRKIVSNKKGRPKLSIVSNG